MAAVAIIESEMSLHAGHEFLLSWGQVIIAKVTGKGSINSIRIIVHNILVATPDR